MELLLIFQISLVTIIYFSQAPVLLALLLILFAALQGLYSYWLLSKWLGLGIIIVFIGGIIVIFLYVTSLATNSKIIQPRTLNFTTLAALLVIYGTFTPFNGASYNLSTVPRTLFTFSRASVVFFLILYLLITLFLATKISESFKGSLVEKF